MLNLIRSAAGIYYDWLSLSLIIFIEINRKIKVIDLLKGFTRYIQLFIVIVQATIRYESIRAQDHSLFR